MKKPNTLPELLRHAADLAEKGDSLVCRFEFMTLDQKWHLCNVTDGMPNFAKGVWRIADQDQHLLDDGWIRHTGDVCPVHPETIVEAMTCVEKLPTSRAARWYWDKETEPKITQYKIVKEYVEPTTFEMKVGDKVFVLNKPYMSAPEDGEQCFVLGVDGEVVPIKWRGVSLYKKYLENYNCWKTEADAKSYAEAKLARDKFEIGEIK